MFWWGFFVGLVLGANISLFIYALITAAGEGNELE